METAFVAFGSNLGDRQHNIDSAIKLLKSDSDVDILKVSSIIETNPVGGPAGQNLFLNGVLKINTTLDPYDLLNLLNKIEKQLGRVRNVKNGPRTIDLDILLYGDIKIDTAKLTIPHPRMQEREFVMQPLYEIAPEYL